MGKEAFVKAGEEAQRKSIVLLRNEEGSLPLANGTKVYFEDYHKAYTNPTPGPGEVYSGAYTNLEFVATPEEADVILLWVKPSIRPLFPADDSPLQVTLSACAVDVDYVNSLVRKKPTILAINFSNPFVIDEIYNDDMKQHYMGVLATFGAAPEALLDVVSGKFNPTGKMPFTTPISQEAVENNQEDVPGYDEGDDYRMFRFGERVELLSRW